MPFPRLCERSFFGRGPREIPKVLPSNYRSSEKKLSLFRSRCFSDLYSWVLEKSQDKHVRKFFFSFKVVSEQDFQESVFVEQHLHVLEPIIRRLHSHCTTFDSVEILTSLRFRPSTSGNAWGHPSELTSSVVFGGHRFRYSRLFLYRFETITWRSMIAIGDGIGVEPHAPSLLPSYCVESTPISSVCSPALSPAATVCGDGDVMRDTAPEFKLSQCFGDCSPAEEATQGETHETMIVSTQLMFLP